jgi:FkbM family methyltransferase
MYGVDSVLDIGANIGQSGQRFRRLGFDGPILSCEPIGNLFEQLRENSKDDPQWNIIQCAVGAQPGDVKMQVSGGSAEASSILEMTENVLRNEPLQRPVREETVQLRTLDSLLASNVASSDRCFVKIDVQGYEGEVINGLEREAERVVGMQVEMSIVRNYKGEDLMVDMLPRLQSRGFALVGLECGWGNSLTSEVYQVDGYFFRSEMLLS